MKSFARFFQIDSPFGQLLSRILDLFCLSLLWITLCLTIVGIGPATAAMYYAIRQCIRSGEQPLLHAFFHALRDGWRQTIPAGLLMVIFTIAAYFTDIPGLFLAWSNFSANFNIFTLISLAKVLLLLWIWLYLFPILSQYQIGLAGAFFQSLILAFSHIGATILMSFMAAAAVFAILRYPLLITLIPSLCAYVFSFLTQAPLRTIAPVQDKNSSTI